MGLAPGGKDAVVAFIKKYDVSAAPLAVMPKDYKPIVYGPANTGGPHGGMTHDYGPHSWNYGRTGAQGWGPSFLWPATELSNCLFKSDRWILTFSGKMFAGIFISF